LHHEGRLLPGHAPAAPAKQSAGCCRGARRTLERGPFHGNAEPVYLDVDESGDALRAERTTAAIGQVSQIRQVGRVRQVGQVGKFTGPTHPTHRSPDLPDSPDSSDLPDLRYPTYPF